MTPAPFHALAKPPDAICHLDCAYGFFLSKEAQHPDSPVRMKDDTLESYIRQVVEPQHAPQVTIAWQGGEPTLIGLDFFRRATALVRQYAKPGMTIEHTIQMNGTLLDEEWCAFFRDHTFLVGLSLDGPRAMHDAYRTAKGGQATFDRVIDAARMLRREGVEHNIICTVHAANGDHPLEVYRFFRDEVKTHFIQFIPIVERTSPALLHAANPCRGAWHRERPRYGAEGHVVTERTVRPEQWGRFLNTIFDEWIGRDVGQVSIQVFDAALAAWPSAMGVVDATRGTLAFTAMGDSLPRYCRECEVRFACEGECPKNRFATTPDGEPGLNYLCAGYKAFFRHIDRPMRLMAERLRRDTVDVMPKRSGRGIAR